MKKFFLLGLLAIGASEVRAQSIAAGTISLGGSIGYSQSSSNSNTAYSGSGGPNSNFFSEAKGHYFYLSPVTSYFVADNLAVGLAFGFGNGRTRVEDAGFNPVLITVRHSRYTAVSLWAGAFGQYYKMLNTQFGLTGRLGAGYQRLNEDRDGYNDVNGITNYFTGTNTSVGYYADFTPGIVFFPVPKFGLNASLGSLGFSHYSLTDSHYNDINGNSHSRGNKNNNFTANFGLDAFRLGGTYYFGR